MLEICLLLICVTLLAGVATLAILLGGANPPLEPAWGNVAEWAGVTVTFLGFVGAFGALLLQRRSVEIQVDQHLSAVQEKKRLEAAERAQQAEIIRKEREKYAAQLPFFASAEFKSNSTGLAYKQGEQLIYKVSATAISAATFENVRVSVPEVPDMDIPVNRTKAARLDYENTKSVAWEARSPRGGETNFTGQTRRQDAPKWLRERVSVEFTDPNGVRWRKYPNGKFDEISAEGHAKNTTNNV